MTLEKMFPKKLVCARIVLASFAAAAVSGAPGETRAAKGQPNPFAGHYGCQNSFDITISDSGRIKGSINGFIDVSGSISDTGMIKGTLTFKRIFGAPPHYRQKSAFVGMGALDANGNLFGVMQFENGGISEFFWPRCE